MALQCPAWCAGCKQAWFCFWVIAEISLKILAGNVFMKTLLQEPPVLQTPRHVRLSRDMSNCVRKTCQTNQVAGTSQKTRRCRVAKTFEDIFNLTIYNALLLMCF
jgi:hypothetical protein